MSSGNEWDPNSRKFQITPPSDDFNDLDYHEVEDDNNEPDLAIEEELKRGRS
ncbi:hypothetical protein ACWZHB_29370 [Nocardia sp. FBN12]|uniref:hypothetical protein n=1 Tax=Nocardia sp. FBN12 TaxID=3419766 RepID=UPI003D041A67